MKPAHGLMMPASLSLYSSLAAFVGVSAAAVSASFSTSVGGATPYGTDPYIGEYPANCIGCGNIIGTPGPCPGIIGMCGGYIICGG